MLNQEIAKIFREMALFYEMRDDRFRARAYENGALELGAMSENVKDIYKKGGLKALEDLPNIGRGIAEKIEEFMKTGKIKEYQALKKEIPVDLEALTRVEGLGPKGVRTLYQKLGIKNLKDLERAAKAGKISKLEGFGEKSEKNILEGIEFVKKSGGRMLLGDALPLAREFMKKFSEMSEVINISEAGSLRRRRETIGDIDILVAVYCSAGEAVIEALTNIKGVEKVWGKGPTKASVRVKEGFDIDLRVVPKESWGSALQYFTGSKAHNIKLRQIAVEKNLKLNEYGLYRGKKRIAGKNEEEIYEALGLKYMEPEIREDTGEIEFAKAGSVPALIEYGSLLGDLQVQTNWTDGDHSIEEMVVAAKAAGLKYIAITDHTKSLAMTGGCDEKKLLRQMAAIDKLNHESRIKNQDFRILKGAEVNILKDGSLDIADEVLAKLDVVGVSVHSLMKMSKKDMTARIIRAIENPHVDILFHPTGRRINKREAYEVDMEEIIKAAVKTKTILEINAHPERLDLKDEYIRMGVNLGARFVIDSDAHNKNGFADLEFGIAQARRGWAEAKDVVNTLPAEEFLNRLK